MDQETLLTIQGYAKVFAIFVAFVVFYSYAFSMYRRQKSGERDFEKYTNLVHDDSLDSTPLEQKR